MIIAVGFKINSDRAVQFRKWVNKIAKDYTYPDDNAELGKASGYLPCEPPPPTLRVEDGGFRLAQNARLNGIPV